MRPVSTSVAAASRATSARGWTPAPGRVTYLAGYATFFVTFRASQHDPGTGLGAPLLYLDDADGTVLRAVTPGRGSLADVILQLQFPLHSGRIAGWPGRIVVFVSGLAVAIVSITGVIVWWNKRARHVST